MGHETDVTLIDFAADRRAPTPTAAAEMAVPVRSGLVAGLEDLESRRRSALRRGLEDRRAQVRNLARALPRPESLLDSPRQRLDAASAGLPRALALWRAAQERRFAEASGRLEAARGRLSERRRGAAQALAVAGERLEQGPRRLIALKARDLAARPLPPPPQMIARRRERLEALAGERLEQAPRRLIALKRREWARALPSASGLASALARRRERLGMASGRQEAALRAARAGRSDRLRGLGQLLESYSFKGVLARGFALARDAEGRPIRSAAALTPGEILTLTLQEGEAKTRVLGPEEETPPLPAPKPRRKAAPKPDAARTEPAADLFGFAAPEAQPPLRKK